MLKINIDNIDYSRCRCIHDLMYIYTMDTYINIKGYLTKLVDMLYKMGYYESNESLFVVKDVKE